MTKFPSKLVKLLLYLFIRCEFWKSNHWILKNFQRWKEKLLSQAGRVMLLKAVVQAIPTFAMSCFKLLVGLCHNIKAMTQKFWWGGKIDWKNWKSLCQPKSKGGMGNWQNLLRRCWQSKFGVWSMIQTLFSILFFRKNTFLMVLFFRPMRSQFGFTKIIGCSEKAVAEFSHHPIFCILMLRCPN